MSQNAHAIHQNANAVSLAFLKDPAALPDKHAAIDLARALLRLVGEDLAAPKRNAHASLRLARRAQAIYKAIFDLIEAVDKAEDVDWTSFNTYTGAIDPLEDLLFDYAGEASDLSSLDFVKHDKDIQKILSAISKWKSDRDKLQTHLTKLYDGNLKSLPDAGPELDKELLQDRKHDDETFLAELVQRISSSKLTEAVVYPRDRRQSTLIAEVKSNASGVLTTFKATKTSTNVSDLSIDSVMAVCLVLELLLDPTTEANSPKRAPKVWRIASDLLKLASNAIQAKGATLEALSAKYTEFINALGGTVYVLPSLLELVKLAAKVRRPYQAQSIAVIRVCQALANEVKENDKEHESPRFKDAIDAAKEALTEAAKDKTEFKNMNPKAIPGDSTTVSKFGAAKTKLQECYEKNDIQGWEAQKKIVEDAAALDKARLVKLLGRLQK